MVAMKYDLLAVFCAWCAFSCLPGGLALSDTVRLKNGGVVEGIISQETGTHLVVEIGTGSMRVKVSDVVSLIRSSEKERRAMRAEWAGKYYLHRKFVPEDMQDVAQAFRDLSAKRNAAVEAWSKLDGSRRLETAARKAIEKAKLQLVDSSHKLKQMDPARNVAEYNALVGRVNALNAEITLRNRELEKERQERKKSPSLTSAYLAALSEFEALLAQRTEEVRKGASDENAPYFVKRLGEEIAVFGDDFSRTTVPTSRAGNGRIVDVTVNGSTKGRFILDTGASLVTMSEEFRRRLDLDVDREHNLDLVLADGSTTRAPSVILDSVSLGDARAERIAAVVLPEPPGTEADGLLGMSFLGRFVLRLDGATGELTLTGFAPDSAE